MTLPDENPYASPTTIASSIEEGTSSGPPVEARTSSGSPTLSLISAVGTIAYLVLAIDFLGSTPGDRMAGLMFLGNLPILIGLTLSIARSKQKGAYFAMIATCIPIGIALVAIQSPGANLTNVLIVTAAIVIPLLAIAVIAWVSKGRSS